MAKFTSALIEVVQGVSVLGGLVIPIVLLALFTDSDGGDIALVGVFLWLPCSVILFVLQSIVIRVIYQMRGVRRVVK